MTRPYAITLFGATGFTGRLTAHVLAHTELPWAIAGRDRSKLEAVRQELIAINPRCASVGIVEASVDQPDSLRQMAEQSDVIATTVGPYQRYGLPVVEACVQAGAHYADITGETSFVEEVRARFDAPARDRGVRLVSTCGFDSIPHDLGVYYTVQQLPADADIAVEGFVRAKGTFSGGTWNSALGIMRDRTRFAAPDAQGRTVKGKVSLHYDKELKTWACPLPTIDPQVILRSAAALPAYGRSFTYGHYLMVRSTFQLGLGFGGVAVVATLARVPSLNRWMGTLRPPGAGPTEAERAASWFTVTFRGTGGGKTVWTQVSGGDPGYTETAKMLAESAICLARDPLPPRAGALTPVVAMGDALLARLQAVGIRFRTLSGPEEAFKRH